MIELHIKYLLLHGSLVLLVGVLSGFPYWLAIILNWGGETPRFWRVTHSFLVVFGLTMLIFALIIQKTALNSQEVRLLVLIMIIAGYGFVFAFMVGSWKKIRGLTPKPYGFNTVLFASHVVGITGSLLGTAILIFGLFRNFF
jgi:membrane-associated HD superfamily phosphohydrolase